MNVEPIVFVLRHTHWDREWYHPESVFRKRLVDLIDELLGAQPNETFLLDGQAILLRDYRAVRPERAAELAAALHNRRLEAGPWYVLPDELIPSGEALVRNLLAGRRALRALRAAAPPLLYCPDSFGHPAALPSLAAGFGCRAIIVWRGYGSRRFPPGDAALWTAPGGEETLLFHLPADGYEFGSHLPADPTEAQHRWRKMREVLEPRSSLGVWLVPNGADHHAPQRDAASAIDRLVEAASPKDVMVGGLAALSALLESRAKAAKLPRVEGELRDSYGYTWTLGGTLATRAHQKRRNAQLERALTRDVEPWAALARFHGAPSSRPHVNSAWETLLACHPHDSLCGCSVDAVAQAVDARMAQAAALATELRESSIAALVGHDPDAARSHSAAWRAAVIVRNPAPRPRAGLAEIDLDVQLAHVPAGPGSAGRTKPVPMRAALGVPCQIVARERRYARIEAPRFYPVNHEIERRRCVVWLPRVGPYGIIGVPMCDSATTADRVPSHATVTADKRGIRSQLGSLTSSLKWSRATERSSARPLFGFEIVRDRGDTYTPSLVLKTTGRGVLRRSRVALRGPLRAAIDSTWRASLRGRPSPRSYVDVQTRAALDAGAAFVRVQVSGDNAAQDHRLRIVFNTGVRPRRVVADAAFAFLERKALRVPAADRRAETPLPTAPLHRFVTVFDGARGCTVVSDGLAEYEVLDNGAVAITLVRAVGQLSRTDLPERPGHAGWPEATPGAQCPGPIGGDFAIAWHGGDSRATRDAILALVDDVLLPLTGETRRDLVTVPSPVDGVALEGSGLAFSALKESDDGQYAVARCVNVTDAEVRGAWVLPSPVAAVHSGRLDETPVAPLDVLGARIPITVAPHAIHTALISLTNDAAPEIR